MRTEIKILLEGLDKKINNWMLQFGTTTVVTDFETITNHDILVIPDSDLRLSLLDDLLTAYQPRKVILLGNMSRIFADINNLPWEPGDPNMSRVYQHGTLSYGENYTTRNGMEYYTAANSEGTGFIKSNSYGVVFRTYLNRDQFSKKDDVEAFKGFPIVHQNGKYLSCSHLPYELYHRQGSKTRSEFNMKYGDVGTNRAILSFLKNNETDEGSNTEKVRVLV